MNALIVSLGPLARFPTFPDAEFLRDQGWDVTLLVTAMPVDADSPHDVRVIELSEVEAVSLLYRGERYLVLSLPRSMLLAVRRLFVRAGRLHGVGRPARSGARLVGRVQTKQARASSITHRFWQRRLYRGLRPYVLWRLTRRLALAQLTEAGADLVLCGDREASVALTWHLARLLPQTPVSFGLDRDRWPELPAPGSMGSAGPGAGHAAA